MERRRKPLTLLLLSVLFLWLLSDAGRVREDAAAALALCGRSVIPALFPFLAVSGLLVAQGFGEWTAPLFSPLMALYRLPGAAGSAVALGLLGGYPVGARTAAELYKAGNLTREEAERLLAFCNNASPAFLVSVLGGGVFGSVRTGVWLLLIHVLSALLTGLLFRCRGTGGREAAPPEPPGPPPALLPSLVEAVGSAAGAMVRVCGFVVFFYTLSGPLRLLGGRRAVIAAGLTELFSLTPLLTPDRFGFVAASALAGFGGLGVACQTAAVLEGSGLPTRPAIAGKAVQGVLAGLLAAGLAGIVL